MQRRKEQAKIEEETGHRASNANQPGGDKEEKRDEGEEQVREEENAA